MKFQKKTLWQLNLGMLILLSPQIGLYKKINAPLERGENFGWFLIFIRSQSLLGKDPLLYFRLSMLLRTSGWNKKKKKKLKNAVTYASGGANMLRKR